MFHWPLGGAPIFDRYLEAESDIAGAAIEAAAAPQAQPADGGRTPDLPFDAPGPARNDRLAALPPADTGEPVRVQGKSFFAGERKDFVRGVTYGPFAPVEVHMARSSPSAPLSNATSR